MENREQKLIDLVFGMVLAASGMVHRLFYTLRKLMENLRRKNAMGKIRNHKHRL